MPEKKRGRRTEWTTIQVAKATRDRINHLCRGFSARWGRPVTQAELVDRLVVLGEQGLQRLTDPLANPLADDSLNRPGENTPER